jgi:zinc finger protein
MVSTHDSKLSVKLLREETMKCPLCNEKRLKVSMYQYKMPLVGPVVLITGKCGSCGYKFVDVRTLESKGKQRIEFKVENEQDLNTLILRSSSATLIIPELNAEISPGPISQGFLTTVEGVLQRFKNIISFLCKDIKNEKERIECEERLKMLEEMLQGKRKFTIIIEDPEGLSRIASNKVIEYLEGGDD